MRIAPGEVVGGRVELDAEVPEGLPRRKAQPRVSRPLDIEITDLAKAQLRTAEGWLRGIA